MPPSKKAWYYTYETLAGLTGQQEETIRQHHARGKFDPDKLESVAKYLARYGLPQVRQAIVNYALSIDASDPVIPRRSSKRS